MRIIFAGYFIFFSQLLFAENIKFKILERGTKIPLKEISVFAFPDQNKAVSDAEGLVEFSLSSEEKIKIIISAAGYIRFEKEYERQNLLEQQTIYLEKESYSQFETVVSDAKNKRDLSQKSLSRKEFLEMPGANGDPLKAVQNLPGINRTQGFSSQVVIQGSAPKDTAYDFEGHQIPIVFHFGGLSSVVMPEALSQVDYLSAGYQVDNSRALGGIISLKSRVPEVSERDTKGLFYMDNLSSGGLLEKKMSDKSSFLISGRYSYIGFFLKNAMKDNEALDLTVAPEFQDITGIYNHELSENDNLKISLLGSKDRLAFVFNEPVRGDPTIRGSFNNTTQFYRLIPAWTHKVNKDTLYKLSLGVGQDEVFVEVGEEYFKLRSQVLTARGEYETKWTENWISQIGWDNQYSRAQVDLKLPLTRGEGGISNPISTGEKRQAQIDSKVNNMGAYFRNDISLTEQFNLMPGLRYDYFSQTKESFLLPRLAAKYKSDETLTFKSATGLYVQAPEPQETSEDYGNPDVKSPHAIHFTLGLEKDMRQNSKEGSVYSINLFDRRYDQLVIQSSAQTVRNGQTVFEVYNNEGRGRSYGLEAQWKFNNSDFNGFISYTWSKSTRWSQFRSEYNFEYDQTHNFNIVVAKPFPNEWKLSSRFRYVTGNPFTPVVGSTYDADNEVYFPKRGAIYSERMKDFYQLDMRLDKKYIYDQSIWTFYLDVQNILNTKNPESIQYSYDYAQKSQVSGLPLLPALGIKGEF